MSNQPNSTPKFSKNNLEYFFEAITSIDVDMKTRYDIYLNEEYEGVLPAFDVTNGEISGDEDWPEFRLAFLEIAEIARYIVEKFRSKQTQIFHDFFYKVEEILCNCDDYVSDLIVTGLLEGIQNISGRQIDYHFGYNQWLLPLVQLKWDALIDMWEGNGWRNRKA